MGAVHLACSTLAFIHLPLSEALTRISKLGFETADLAAFGHAGSTHLDPAAACDNLLETTTGLLTTAERTGMQYGAVNTGYAAMSLDAEHQQVTALCLMAHRIGAGVLTLPAGRGSVDDTARRLAPLVDIGARYGVVVTVETHLHSVTERPESALELVRRTPGLKLTFDPSHYLIQGDAPDAWKEIVPHVAHVHLRDAGQNGWENVQVPWGNGALNLVELLHTLDAADYSGLLSIEYIHPEWLRVRPHDTVSQIIKLKAALESALAG